MANHKSALKRIKQSLVKREANRAVKSTMRTAIKAVKTAVTAGNKEEIDVAFKSAQKIIAMTASKGIINKNTGSRYISRLSNLVRSNS